MHSNWLLWQIADSAFPAGALGHSCGLEAACQSGLVHDAPSLREFLQTLLHQLQHGVAVFVHRAWSDPGNFADHDRGCDLFLNTAVANRGSRAQGRAFLATCAQTFDRPALQACLTTLRCGKSPGHLAPVFGLVARTLNFEEDETAQLFTFTTARTCLSAAIRLGIIGPLEAQRIQSSLSGSRCASMPSCAPVSTSPLLDLVQSTQDRLYSRLFQS